MGEARGSGRCSRPEPDRAVPWGGRARASALDRLTHGICPATLNSLRALVEGVEYEKMAEKRFVAGCCLADRLAHTCSNVGRSIAHSPTAIFIGFLSVIAYLLASAKFVAWILEADVDRHLNDKIVRKILGKSLPPANRNW